MPNKNAKMQNFKNTLIVFGLIILFIGCFLLAVITPFAITLHDKVAHADSTDGVVEDNLLLDGDNFASSVWTNDRNTIIQYIPYLSMTSSIAWTGFSQDMSTSLRNTTITCSALVKVSNGTGALGFRYRQGSSGGTTSLGQVSFTNSDWQVKSWTATVPDISLSLLRLVIYCQTVGVQVDVKWVKVEVGTSFTGYVPKDYINYGYTQGYNDGTKDTLEVYNTVRGYTILGSTTQYLNDVVFAGKNYFSSPNPSLAGTTIPNLPKLFSYNGEDYYLVHLPGHNAGTLLNFNANYLYSMIASTNLGYAAVPIGIDISYTGSKKLYLCKDFTIAGNYNIIVRSSDGLNTIIIDTYTVDAYFSNVPVMDLSKYLSKGVSYNFYLVSKTVADSDSYTYSSFMLDTHNTYFAGLNSLCIITIEDGDQIGQSSYEEGRKSGYSAGKLTGYWEGYADGYSQGELVAPAEGQYTFLGVIGALFDAPIGALSSFLNFDLLGFNMRSFFFALISLAFIILVLRIVLGSKL